MPLRLEIVSPERRVYDDEVDMVIVPGRNGQLGILPRHTPLISSLGVGELRIKKGGTEQSLLISGGFVEVRPDKVIVMADLAEHSDEIDEAKAVEARKRAERLAPDRPHARAHRHPSPLPRLTFSLPRLRFLGAAHLAMREPGRR